MEAFPGIDVAFAKRKRLPVCLCVWENSRLIPLQLSARGVPDPPRGRGNVASIDPPTVALFADEVVDYLRFLEKHFSVSIRRIAIDAPSDPKQECLSRRQAETAMDRLRISCFTTPNASEFEKICEKVKHHLRTGGLESRLPHANQLWMLVGFALFRRLRLEWECLEVYPQATMRVLGAASVYKFSSDGLCAQLLAVSRHTGWPDPPVRQPLQELKRAVRAPLHDGLDAYSSAWVAALDHPNLKALGCPPNDAIWVPSLPNAPMLQIASERL
jgi:Protein of unknown function (DUF429)